MKDIIKEIVKIAKMLEADFHGVLTDNKNSWSKGLSSVDKDALLKSLKELGVDISKLGDLPPKAIQKITDKLKK